MSVPNLPSSLMQMEGFIGTIHRSCAGIRNCCSNSLGKWLQNPAEFTAIWMVKKKKIAVQAIQIRRGWQSAFQHCTWAASSCACHVLSSRCPWRVQSSRCTSTAVWLTGFSLLVKVVGTQPSDFLKSGGAQSPLGCLANPQTPSACMSALVNSDWIRYPSRHPRVEQQTSASLPPGVPAGVQLQLVSWWCWHLPRLAVPV